MAQHGLFVRLIYTLKENITYSQPLTNLPLLAHICPQIWWSFQLQKTAPFSTSKWIVGCNSEIRKLNTSEKSGQIWSEQQWQGIAGGWEGDSSMPAPLSLCNSCLSSPSAWTILSCRGKLQGVQCEPGACHKDICTILLQLCSKEPYGHLLEFGESFSP